MAIIYKPIMFTDNIFHILHSSNARISDDYIDIQGTYEFNDDNNSYISGTHVKLMQLSYFTKTYNIFCLNYQNIAVQLKDDLLLCKTTEPQGLLKININYDNACEKVHIHCKDIAGQFPTYIKLDGTYIYRSSSNCFFNTENEELVLRKDDKLSFLFKGLLVSTLAHGSFEFNWPTILDGQFLCDCYQFQKLQVCIVSELENNNISLENTDCETKNTDCETKNTDCETKNTDCETKNTDCVATNTDCETKNTDCVATNTDCETKNICYIKHKYTKLDDVIIATGTVGVLSAVLFSEELRTTRNYNYLNNIKITNKSFMFIFGCLLTTGAVIASSQKKYTLPVKKCI